MNANHNSPRQVIYLHVLMVSVCSLVIVALGCQPEQKKLPNGNRLSIDECRGALVSWINQSDDDALKAAGALVRTCEATIKDNGQVEFGNFHCDLIGGTFVVTVDWPDVFIDWKGVFVEEGGMWRVNLLDRRSAHRQIR